MSKTTNILITIILYPFAILWGLFVAKTLWFIYAVPAGLPSLSLLQIFGVSLAINSLGYLGAMNNPDEDASPLRGLFVIAAVRLFILIVGLLVMKVFL